MAANTERLRNLACGVEFSNGNTVLHQFVLDNSDPNDSCSEIYITAVLRSMADVPETVANAQNDDKYTALHLAVAKNNLFMVKNLLSCLVNIDVNARMPGSGNAALHLAADLGNLPLIQELLNKGANVNIANEFNETALCYAARSGHLDAMKLLVSKGASVDERGACGTPLCYAVFIARSLEAAEFLVRSGADVNFRGGWTPLNYAASKGDLAIVEFLIKNGADVNIKAVDNDTPLHHAACSESLEVVQCLIRNGADIDAKNQEGETPLHHAVSMRKAKNAAFLLRLGADVDAKDENGHTPLHYAVNNGDLELVDFLIDEAADIDAENEEGEMPLHLAVHNRNNEVSRFFRLTTEMRGRCEGNLRILKLLIDEGADLLAIDEHGRIPSHVAVCQKDFKIAASFSFQSASRYGGGIYRGWFSLYDKAYRCHAKVIRMLLKSGADVSSRNKDGETPLDIARHPILVDALQRYYRL